MPLDRSRYPLDWEDISLRIRRREGWRCKWCGVKQGEVKLSARGRPYKIILTVAHLGAAKPDGSPGDPHDKLDVRDENLAALCQPCHLSYDAPEHRRQAARNRLARKLAAGQLPLDWRERQTAQRATTAPRQSALDGIGAAAEQPPLEGID